MTHILYMFVPRCFSKKEKVIIKKINTISYMQLHNNNNNDNDNNNNAIRCFPCIASGHNIIIKALG